MPTRPNPAQANKPKYLTLPAEEPSSKPWPRLSQQLTEIRHPEFCQSCGVHEGASETDLSRWREHDDQDRPEWIVVVLCGACANALIEPHPRLYDKMPEGAPWPGCMPLCVGCRFRAELTCTHPDAKQNGGEGVALTMPQPFVAFVDGRTGPKGGLRGGRRVTVYNGPVSACAGRETMECREVIGS